MEGISTFPVPYQFRHGIDEIISNEKIVEDAFNTSQMASWDSITLKETLSWLKNTSEPPSLDDLIDITHKFRNSKKKTHAKRLYMHIAKYGLETHRLYGNYLVPMFVECGDLFEAEKLFLKLCYRNEYSWSSLIQGYVECGDFEQALDLFEKMQGYLMKLDVHALVSLLKACTKLKKMETGQYIYGDIVKHGFEWHPFVCSGLIDLYAKSGFLADAEEVFDRMQSRDAVAWNALIAGYVEHGEGEEALNQFEQMQCEDIIPTLITFISGVKACSSIRAIQLGQKIHCDIVKEGYEAEAFIGSTLVDMYAKCGLLVEAKEVFNEFQVRDVVSWTALISGYTEQGLFEEALDCIRKMQRDGISPNAVTYICSLKACASIGAIDKGLQLHADIITEGLEVASCAASTLVAMYAKCGLIMEARELFNEILHRDVVAWTAIIDGYSEHGLVDEAMSCIDQMILEGMSPDRVMFLCCVKACCKAGAVDKGRVIHAKVVKEGYEDDLFIGNVLIDMYGKSGFLLESQVLFDEIQTRDVVSWNALIAAYIHNGFPEEAEYCLGLMQSEGVFTNGVSWNTVILYQAQEGETEKVFRLFSQMQEQGILPDDVVFVSILTTAGDAAIVEAGKKIHVQVYKPNQLKITDLTVQTSLVDMYSKCGSMFDAQKIFDSMPRKDLVGWSALSMGYARQGDIKKVSSLFKVMENEGIKPDEYSLHCILTACSHAGLVGNVQNYVNLMNKERGINLSRKHHNSLLDVLCRAGQLDEALTLLESMPYEPSLVTWIMMLGACQKWGNMELAEDAFSQAIRSIEKESGPYILMYNIIKSLRL